MTEEPIKVVLFAADCGGYDIERSMEELAAAAAGRTLCAYALPRVVLGTLQHAKPQHVRFCWNRFAASCYNNPKTAAAAAGRTLCAYRGNQHDLVPGILQVRQCFAQCFHQADVQTSGFVGKRGSAHLYDNSHQKKPPTHSYFPQRGPNLPARTAVFPGFFML